MVNATPRPLCPGERPGTHCIGGWVGPRAGAENLAPTGIRTPDRPARSESVYANILGHNQGCTNFPNIYHPAKSTASQNNDVKPVP
jgi:hypothetical protein